MILVALQMSVPSPGVSGLPARSVSLAQRTPEWRAEHSAPDARISSSADSREVEDGYRLASMLRAESQPERGVRRPPRRNCGNIEIGSCALQANWSSGAPSRPLQCVRDGDPCCIVSHPRLALCIARPYHDFRRAAAFEIRVSNATPRLVCAD